MQDYLLNMQNKAYKVEQLMFQDESLVNKNTMKVAYGYCRSGKKCYSKRYVSHPQSRTLIATISAAGLVGQAGVYHKGSTTADVMEQYLVEKLLPHTNPFPLPNSVLVIDNAGYHNVERIRALCGAYGVVVETLPHYSPELNPIELLWSSVKYTIRAQRTRLLDQRFFAQRLLQIVTERAQEVRCKKWVAKSGYFHLCA